MFFAPRYVDTVNIPTYTYVNSVNIWVRARSNRRKLGSTQRYELSCAGLFMVHSWWFIAHDSLQWTRRSFLEESWRSKTRRELTLEDSLSLSTLNNERLNPTSFKRAWRLNDIFGQSFDAIGHCGKLFLTLKLQARAKSAQKLQASLHQVLN